MTTRPRGDLDGVSDRRGHDRRHPRGDARGRDHEPRAGRRVPRPHRGDRPRRPAAQQRPRLNERARASAPPSSTRRSRATASSRARCTGSPCSSRTASRRARSRRPSARPRSRTTRPSSDAVTVRKLRDAGAIDPRQDHAAGLRDVVVLLLVGERGDEEPVRPRPRSRRLERGHRRGDRREPGHGRHRHRLRRLDPPALARSAAWSACAARRAWCRARARRTS